MDIKATSNPFSGRRITFIDLLRAYAILMMLQGHFTDTLLAMEYRDFGNPVFGTWYFMRGMTAPIFFFASGLIFVFLLLRDKRPFWENQRLRKGLRRGGSLILIGYLLRASFPRLLSFDIYPGLFSVDVLHCIGLALWALIATYLLSQYLRLSFPVLLGSGALLVFFIEPVVKGVDWSFLPFYLENYLVKTNGSVFTPIPWIGYSMLGGVLGYGLHKRPQWAFGHVLPLLLLAFGFLLHFRSDLILINLYELTGVETFYAHATNNYILYRLGHVFIAVALFIWIAQLWRNISPLLLRIGSETLLIYEVHYVLLYSTWLGIGLSTWWYHSLNPWQTVLGAILFELFFVFLIANIDLIRSYDRKWFRNKIFIAWRIVRIRTVRFYHRLAYG